MTHWPELENNRSSKRKINPWCLALAVSLPLWAAIFWAADMVRTIYG